MAPNDQFRYSLGPHPRRRARKNLVVRSLTALVLVGVIGTSGVFLLPQLEIAHVRTAQVSTKVVATTIGASTPFPVSVNPATKSIVDNPQADAFFTAQRHNSLAAAVDTVQPIFDWIAQLIDNTKIYQDLAAADGHLITVLPGYRKEEVLSELSSALRWNKTEQQEFIKATSAENPGITEGMFAPGTYVVDNSMTPTNVAALMNVRFNQTVLSHYSSATAAVVPLNETLTVASLLEREAAGPTDMRIISGIIWNRLFKNMNLQIDASLQYAKGDVKGNWWSTVVPKDKYIVSAYNTYAHAGLPPGPIAEPSLAAVVAALNPVKTSCVYYFHDRYGHFHCSDTYAEHVALLKKYYGQGK